MIDLELQLVRENPHWLTVLYAYQAAHEEQAQQAAQASASPPIEDASAEEQHAEEQHAEEQHAEEAGAPTEAGAGRPRKSVWLPRLTKLDGIVPEELSRTHGGLIAYGLLKCDLADRSTGVVYQLTSVARQVIERQVMEPQSTEPPCVDQESDELPTITKDAA